MDVSTAANVVAASCRLTIMSSARRVDLAVPVQISVAELLTIVVTSLGPEAADLGVSEGGWVLQRAGADPLHPARTLEASGVVDGDVLHLRTRSTQLPVPAFDDVLDAVAEGVRTRTQRWAPRQTAWAATVFAGALLTDTFGTAVLVGPSWLGSAITLGIGAVLLAVTAAALGRVLHRRGPALTAAGFAIAYAAGCGATALGGHRRIVDFGAVQLLVGSGAALVVAVVLLVVLAVGVAGFMAVATLALLAAVGTAVAAGLDLRPAATAGVVAAAALAVSPALPLFALRLSRLPVPAVALDADDLERDTGVDTRQVLDQAERADQLLTGLVGGVSLAIAGSAVVLAGQGVGAQCLAVVLGIICLLRARVFSGRGQRVLLLVSGALALAAELVAATAQAHGALRLFAFAVPAGALALVLLGLSTVLPGRRYAPPASRAADSLESLLMLSVIPLAVDVVGVYGFVHNLVS